MEFFFFLMCKSLRDIIFGLLGRVRKRWKFMSHIVFGSCQYTNSLLYLLTQTRDEK